VLTLAARPALRAPRQQVLRLVVPQLVVLRLVVPRRVVRALVVLVALRLVPAVLRRVLAVRQAAQVALQAAQRVQQVPAVPRRAQVVRVVLRTRIAPSGARAPTASSRNAQA
jgi:hypothetical protein